jgi:hypothetical protein
MKDFPYEIMNNGSTNIAFNFLAAISATHSFINKNFQQAELNL